MKHPRGRIALFAKTPQIGRVKTRLAADLGDEVACHVYCAMLKYTVCMATQAGIADVVLYAYPDIDSAFLRELSEHYPITLRQQHGRDLGERMANAISAQLREADFVILIGTDCLLIDKSYLAQTADRLASGISLVFGPADDGGYVMIGMSRPHTEVFADIDWGSADVMAQSRAHCQRLGLSMEELPALFDIDTLPDWERLQRNHPHIVNQLYDFNGKPGNGTQIIG